MTPLKKSTYYVKLWLEEQNGFLNGSSPAAFYLFSVKPQWRYTNLEPLESEATALPTEPQLLPALLIFTSSKKCLASKAIAFTNLL